METSLFSLAIATLVFWVAFGIELVVGNRSIRFLKDVPLSKRFPVPKVSIIIPARNEEENIQKALESVLAQDYENVEITVINDRSTDQTTAILDRVAQAESRIHRVRVADLPQGWLGKNHALYLGAQQATGELLLFTDADVVMHSSTVSRAVGYMVEHHLDHLTLVSEVRMPGALLELFTGAFTMFFCLYARPWKAKDPKSRRYVGIGGFNLLRADVYRAVGTHRAIAMRPDDDMKLGKLIKSHGYKQEMLFGKEMTHVEWYSSLRELITGLMKNAFAGLDYNVAAVVGASTAQFVLYGWPFLGILLTVGSTQMINGMIVLVIVLLYWDNAQCHNLRRWYGIGAPIAAVLFIYILWRATLTTILNNGIDWRGTHYSLAELKANRV